MKYLIGKIFLSMILLSNLLFAQLYNDYSDIDSKDIIDALSFSGIGIFKFDVDSLANKKNYCLILDEYAGKDKLIKTDTLVGKSPFLIRNQKNNKIRFLTKVIDSSYKDVRLYIDTPSLSCFYELKIDKKYARKHYWIKFVKSLMDRKSKIPLLFFASEWDSEFDGQKVTRFCSLNRIPIDLNEDSISEIPHFYIISILFE